MAMMSMPGPSALATMVGVGAGLMYFLDPQAGRQRRSFVRDHVTHSVRAIGDAVDSSRHDLRNRAEGISAGIHSLFGRVRHFIRATVEDRAAALDTA